MILFRGFGFTSTLASKWVYCAISPKKSAYGISLLYCLAVDGRILTVNNRTMTVDDRTMAVDGQTMAVDGQTMAVDGRIMAVDGQTMAVDGRIMASDRNFYISAFRLKSSTLNLQYDFQQKCFISKLLISENP